MDCRDNGEPLPDFSMTVDDAVMTSCLHVATRCLATFLLEGELRHPTSDGESDGPHDAVCEVDAEQVDMVPGME